MKPYECYNRWLSKGNNSRAILHLECYNTRGAFNIIMQPKPHLMS